MGFFSRTITIIVTVVAIGSAGCTRLRTVVAKKITPTALVSAFDPATIPVWVQASPTATAPMTASWVKSIEASLTNQKIQFYSDASCSTAQGALIDLASTTTQARTFTPPGSGTYSFKITSIALGGATADSLCSTPMVYDLVPPVNPTALLWSETSPHSGNAVTASWTKSVSTDLAAQNIQFYSDTTCSTLSGSLAAVSPATGQTYAWTAPGDGSYTYKLTSFDALGNASVSGCSSVMVIDTTAPTATTSLTWVQTSPYNSNSVTASWTKSVSADLSAQKIQFYSDATCTATSGSLTAVSPATGQTTAITMPGDGSYTYKITSLDAAGNSSVSSCSAVMVIDSVAPANATVLSWTETSPYNALLVHSSWTKSVATDLASQKIQYYADATCTSASGSLVTLTAAAQTNAFTAPAEGSYTYKLTSIDTAGNSVTSGCSGVMVIDTTAPTNATLLSWTETSPHSGTSVNASWTKSVSTDLASQKIQYFADATCTVTSGSLTSLTAAAQTNAFTAPGDGSYTYQITSLDTAGNSATSACSAVMVIDTTAPANATLLSWVESTPHVGTSVNASWTKSVATDLAAQKIQFYADGTCTTTSGSLTTITPATAQTYAWTAPGAGTFSYKITSIDAAANASVSSCSSAMVIGAPNLTWTTSTFDFSNGSNPYNRLTLAKTESIFMVLANNGTADATGCSAPTLSNSTDYEISIDNCGTANLTFGSSCTVAVRAKPQTAGTKTTTISRICTVGGTAAGTSNGLTITAGAGTPQAGMSEGDHGTGVVSLTKTGNYYDLFFINNGTADNTGCSAPTLDNTTDFSIVSNTCGTSNALVDSACRIRIAASPASTGDKYATVYRSCAGASTQTYSNGITVTGATQSNPSQLSSAYDWACVLLANGKIRCWGDPGSAGVGDGNSGQYVLYPVEVANISTATAVAIGRRHGCAIVGSGAVNCWGENSYGQVGNGTFTDQLVPVAVTGITTAISIASGENFSCAVLTNHTVKCWGQNDNGQIGNNTNVMASSPQTVSGISNALSVSLQEQTACAVLTTGGMKCWGLGNSGQLGNSTWSTSYVPVTVTGISTASKVASGGSFSCALLADNTVQCWGNNGSGQLGVGNFSGANAPAAVPGLSNVTALAAAQNHVCALLSDTSMKCWGDNSRSHFGDSAGDAITSPASVVGMTGLSAIAASYRNTCGIFSSTSTVQCFGTGIGGDGYFGQTPPSREPVAVLDITTATQIIQGYNHTCALLSNNTIKCWGYNRGALGNGVYHPASRPTTVSGITTAVEVAAGGNTTCARLASGAVKCWGNNLNGEMGAGVSSNEEVLPLTVSGISTATQIAVGGDHACALLADKSIKCWGYNNEGELGNGANSDVNSPVSVTGITTALEIRAGEAHTCARLSGGVVKCWGWNGFGQLGNGNTTDSNVPVTVTGLINATSLAIGTNHSCAILSDQSVRCWGSNNENQLGNPASSNPSLSPQPVYGLANAVKIAAMENTVCIMDSNSLDRCWGMGHAGQAGNRGRGYPETPSTVYGLGTTIDVSIGTQHGCAIITGGSIKCWGSSGETENLGYINTDTPYLKNVSGF